MKNFLVQGKSVIDIFGQILPPPGAPANANLRPQDALVSVLNVALNLTMIIAGFVTLINFIRAGYTYLTAGADAKKLDEAHNIIKWSAVGLLIVVMTPLAAAIIGYIVFKDPMAIIKPTIKTIQ